MSKELGIHLFTGKLKIEIFDIFTFSSNSEFALVLIYKCHVILAQCSRTKVCTWKQRGSDFNSAFTGTLRQ